MLRVVTTAVALAAIWAALLCFPQPFFSSSVQAGHLTLHSDHALPIDAATRVLAQAESNLAKSVLWTNDRNYDIYICNSRWRQAIFFNKDYGVAGVAPYPLTSNVFLRDSIVDQNQLISPGGKPVSGDRTLDYFIAHEVTHQLTGRALGPVAYLRLPQWIREGYADYIGKGSQIDLDGYRKAFLAGAQEMNYRRSGLYREFHLFVAWQLIHEGWTVDRLLHNYPPEATVVGAVRAN